MTDEDYSLGKHAWFVIVLIGNLLLLLLVVVVIIVIVVVVVIMHCVVLLPATEIEGRFMVSWEISISSSLVIVVLIVIDPW